MTIQNNASICTYRKRRKRGEQKDGDVLREQILDGYEGFTGSGGLIFFQKNQNYFLIL